MICEWPSPLRPAGTSGSVQVCYQLRTSVCSTSPPPHLHIFSSSPPHLLLLTCTDSTLFSRSAITARHSSKVHAGNRAMCRGHKSAAAAGAPAPLRSGPPLHLLHLLWAAGRERSPPPAAALRGWSCSPLHGARWAAAAGPVLYRVTPSGTGLCASIHPAGQEEEEERRDKQTNKQEQTELMQLLWSLRAEPQRGRSRTEPSRTRTAALRLLVSEWVTLTSEESFSPGRAFSAGDGTQVWAAEIPELFQNCVRTLQELCYYFINRFCLHLPLLLLHWIICQLV